MIKLWDYSKIKILGRGVTPPYHTIRGCSVIDLLFQDLYIYIFFLLGKIGQSFPCIFKVIPVPAFQQHL